MAGGVMRVLESWPQSCPIKMQQGMARTPPDLGEKVAECNVCRDNGLRNCIEPTGARAYTSVIRFPRQLAYKSRRTIGRLRVNFGVRDRFRNTPLPAAAIHSTKSSPDCWWLAVTCFVT